MRANRPRRPVRPVAEVSSWGGVRFRLADDWTWALAPGSRRPAGVVALMLADLGAIGRVGEGLPDPKPFVWSTTVETILGKIHS